MYGRTLQLCAQPLGASWGTSHASMVQGKLWLLQGLPWLCLAHHASLHVRQTFDTRAVSTS